MNCETCPYNGKDLARCKGCNGMQYWPKIESPVVRLARVNRILAEMAAEGDICN